MMKMMIINANFVLFFDLMNNIQFTNTGALVLTCIMRLRHLSHLLCFTLHEFLLLILCETSDVWLGLRMPPRESSRILYHCMVYTAHTDAFSPLHKKDTDDKVSSAADGFLGCQSHWSESKVSSNFKDRNVILLLQCSRSHKSKLTMQLSQKS